MTKVQIKKFILSAIFGLFIFTTTATFGADLASISADISEDIQSSQQALSQVQAEISQERSAFAENLNQAQNSITNLREQSIASRRLADEQTLSLNQLEDRLATWREQSNFQTRLLSSFNDQIQHQNDAVIAVDEDLILGLQRLSRYVSDREQALQPQWQTTELVMLDGQITQAEQLTLGPIDLFWQPEESQGGIVDSSEDLAKVALLFAEGAQQNISSLFETSQGAITFDPTLSRALILEVQQETILQHLEKGGMWVIPILLFALFASIVALIKSISLWRLPKLLPALAHRVENLQKDSENSIDSIRQQVGGAQAELLDISLQPQTPEQRDDLLFACLLEHKHKLERWLGAIAVTAAVSPLLGLLGTVSGMITTFKLMTLFGAGDPSSVSSGISEALVTTELGLIVAIPALLAHALMSRKVKSYFSQLENNAIQLSQLQIQEAA